MIHPSARLLFLSLVASVLLLPTSEAKDKTKERRKVDKLQPLVDFIESETMFSPESGFTVLFEQEPVSGEHKGDVDLAAQRLHLRNGQMLWNAQQSLPVSTSVYTEDHLAALGDGSGGLFAVYRATAKTGKHAEDSEVLAQRLSPEGKPLWHEGKKSTVVASTEWNESRPLLSPDGKGGVIVVYQLSTDKGQHAGDSDLAAQRIDANGNLVWEAKEGVPVSNSDVRETNHAILPRPDGGVLVVFEATPRKGKRAGISGIFAQAISVDGKLLWNQGEHPTAVSLSTWSEHAPTLISDGAGGAFVVFTQHSITGEHAGDKDLAVQRILADGTMAWNKGERSMIISDSKFMESKPVLMPDGAGGIIVAFESEPRTGERTGNSDIWAQRIGPDGKRLWNDGKPALVATSLWSERSPSITPTAGGDVLIAFEQHAPRGEHAGDVDIAAQRLDSKGTVLWHDGGRAIELANSARKETQPTLLPDGEGGAVMVFQAEARSGQYAGDKDIHAVRFDANGTLLWNEGKQPAVVATSALMERNFVVVTQ
ncbi:MAG: hypothetical protein VX519_03035 [Myxococcota bacterium]|nr:hypothetical protein [Myxococcota bacterium]